MTTYNSFYAAVGGVYGNVEEQHKERNRYPDTFPYASNRVTLKRYENDYINASWIVHEGHTYIATQAPINATINHFWKMVFEAHRTDSDAGVGQIVMLADETIPTQSTAYWPVKDEGTYVKVTVTIVERKEMQPGIIFRRLTLSKEGQPTKTLHHWQFKAWPDKKVPVMTDFHNFFALVEADRLQNFPNHIQLVHCSAGLGRTGVYIAWKGLLAQIKAGKSCLNLFQTLVDLRRQRMNMVPSFVQYEFLQRLIEHQLNSEKK